MDQVDQDALKALAYQIPAGGQCVEIGSFCGGSAKLILDNAPDDIFLTCFDHSWLDPDVPGAYINAFSDRDLEEGLEAFLDQWNFKQYPNTWDFASEYLRFNSNVKLVPSRSPYDVKWNTPVDFVFEDSSHKNPQLKDNLQFWWPKVKPGGVLAGHDYNPNYPDIIREVLNFARNAIEVHIIGTLWWVVKP